MTKNPRIKFYLFSFLQGFLGIVPIIIYMVINWDKLFGERTTCISNMFGFIIAMIFMVLIFTKQTGILKGLGGFIIFAIIVTLLRTVMEDLYIISWCAVAGMCMAKFIGIWTEKYKNEINALPQTNSMASMTDKIVEAININGRG